MIEESPVLIQSMNWTNFTEKRIKDLNVKTKTILKQLEKMTEEKKEGVITLEINLNSTKTTYDAKRLELLKNSLKILKRRTVRLIRKSYFFFQILMGRIYIEIVFSITRIIMMSGQRFLNIIELTDKIVNVFISIYTKKKNEQRVHKTNESIIPFMSIIDKSWNITDMNSQNSCDVSSLSQAYVFFKLSQVSNGYKYKLRSIFESHGRSLFLKNEIKDYFFRIQGGRLNSKLRHKNRPDSIMNQWINWLKVHYQYALPQSGWSKLVPQKWRKRIHEHRVAQKKNLVEYDSSEKNQFIFYKKQKKQQVDLLEKKKKIKKQYGYDLFSYQYINYADNKKSYIYGYKSPLQANKNQTINYNIPKNKKELFDIMGDSFIQNYIAEDGIIDMDMETMEKNLNRKYLNWMGKRKKNSKTNQKLLTPRFGFFSKLSAYKKNPWILPMNFFFVQFYGNKNITDVAKLKLEKKEYGKQADLKSYLSNYYRDTRYSITRYRKDLNGEQNFLLDKYFGFYLHCKTPVQETLMDNINLYCLLILNFDELFFLNDSWKNESRKNL
ncbi:hypothetical protein RYX36_007609 [Vicia faba]